MSDPVIITTILSTMLVLGVIAWIKRDHWIGKTAFAVMAVISVVLSGAAVGAYDVLPGKAECKATCKASYPDDYYGVSYAGMEGICRCLVVKEVKQ